MKEAYCEWHDKPMKEVAEWQQEQCAENGMHCIDCEHFGEKEAEDE